jgi:xanthine dehydrogenase small subunit
MRSYVLVYINGKRHEISGDQASMNLARFLRYEKSMSGTKIVCSEGDCGACTVLISRHVDKKRNGFHTINSCIAPMYLLDCCHIITVEGIKEKDRLHPVQESMAKNHGAQCGYCTPGFICSMTSLVDDMKKRGLQVTEQKTKNYLTGNLCRCTGYKSIIESAMDVNLEEVTTMDKRYDSDKIDHDFDEHLKVSVKINYTCLLQKKNF